MRVLSDTDKQQKHWVHDGLGVTWVWSHISASLLDVTDRTADRDNCTVTLGRGLGCVTFSRDAINVVYHRSHRMYTYTNIYTYSVNNSLFNDTKTLAGILKQDDVHTNIDVVGRGPVLHCIRYAHASTVVSGAILLRRGCEAQYEQSSSAPAKSQAPVTVTEVVVTR